MWFLVVLTEHFQGNINNIWIDHKTILNRLTTQISNGDDKGANSHKTSGTVTITSTEHQGATHW